MHRSQAVCRECSRAVPAPLKDALKAAITVEARRAAVRAIIAHVTSQPELF